MSFLGRSRPSGSLVRLENLFLTYSAFSLLAQEGLEFIRTIAKLIVLSSQSSALSSSTGSFGEIALYCATIALGGYSSHSGKIHIIQDADLSLYMWHHLWQTLAIYASGLVTPSIHLLPADLASVRTEPLMGHILGSSTSALIYQACTSKWAV